MEQNVSDLQAPYPDVGGCCLWDIISHTFLLLSISLFDRSVPGVFAQMQVGGSEVVGRFTSRKYVIMHLA